MAASQIWNGAVSVHKGYIEIEVLDSRYDAIGFITYEDEAG